MNNSKQEFRKRMTKEREEKKAELLAYLDQQTNLEEKAKAAIIDYINFHLGDANPNNETWDIEASKIGLKISEARMEEFASETLFIIGQKIISYQKELAQKQYDYIEACIRARRPV